MKVSFFDRLKERKLVQWALAYAAAAWVLLETTGFVSDRFAWPEVIVRALTILAGVGLLVTLVLAWYHGEKGQQRVGGVELLLIGTVLAVGAFGLSRLTNADSSDPMDASAALAPADRVSVILADFENHTPDPELGQITRTALRVDLAGSRHLELVEGGALGAALRRMQLDPSTPLTRDVALEVAQREGVPFVVVGRIDAIGGVTQFLAELIRPGEELTVDGRRAVAEDSARVIEAIGELGRGIREDAGESARSISEAPSLPHVTTTSLEALRLYARGRGLMAEPARAVELLERAVEADTTFAMGYRLLGSALNNAGAERSRGIEATRRAYQFRNHLIEQERLNVEIDYHRRVSGDLAATLEAARAIAELGPGGTGALARVYADLGRHRQAVAAYERFIGDRENPGVLNLINAADQYIAVRDFERANEFLTRAAELRPGWWAVAIWRARVARARGEYNAAEHQLDELDAAVLTDAARLWLTDERYGLYLRRGQGNKALAQLEVRYSQRESEGLFGEAVREATRVANLHSRLLGAGTDAEVVLEQALSEHATESIPAYNVHYPLLIESYAWAGRPDLSRRLLSEYERRVASDERGHPYGKPGLMERVTSQVVLAEGDPNGAVGLLRDGLELYCHRARCAVLLAMAHDEAARPDSAMTWYERFLEMPRPATLDDEYLAPTLERLAQLHDEHGDSARAEALYARFVDQWGEADAELQPRVEAARARLGR